MIHPNIFKEFDVNVKQYYKFRATYICDTDKGLKAIRKSECTPEQVTLQHKIKEHLVYNGFIYVDRLHVSKRKIPYVIHNNQLYVMTDWYNGQEVDFHNIQDINKAIRLLASFHMAGERFDYPSINPSFLKIKNLGIAYRKRYSETIKLRKKIRNTSSMTDFELLYIKNVPIYKELQEMAIELIHPTNYEKLVDKAQRKRTIVHGKYTYHNLLNINPEDIVITGFERSTYNVQLTDLANVIRHIMGKNSWDIKILSTCLKEYSNIKPLTANEWEIMKGMIIFPEKFASLCNQYYHSKRRWNYNMFQRKLTNMIEYQENQKQCVSEILKW